MKESLQCLLDDMRECSNQPPIAGMRRKDRQKWALFCTCLDTLGDTQSAIEAFKETSKEANKSELYLRVYGALQAMFVQQDALHNLAELLGISVDIKTDPCVKSIRDVRNNIVGHPTARGPEKRRYSYRISQHTLGATRFEALEIDPQCDPKIIEVNVYELTMRNERLLTRFLENIIAHVRLQWIDHAKKFRRKLLACIIPQIRIDEVNHILCRLQEWGGYREHLVRYIDKVHAAILELESALQERNHDLVEARKLHFICTKFAIHEVRIYIGEQSSIQLDLPDMIGMWIQAYCSALRGLFCELSDLPSVESGPLDAIKSTWNYHTQKVEEAASSENNSVCYALINIESIKDAIRNIVRIVHIRETDSKAMVHIRSGVNRICEITESLECCVASNTMRTHEGMIYSDVDLFVCLLFLREHLGILRECSLEIDDEYDAPVLPEDCAAHP